MQSANPRPSAAMRKMPATCVSWSPFDEVGGPYLRGRGPDAQSEVCPKPIRKPPSAAASGGRGKVRTSVSGRRATRHAAFWAAPAGPPRPSHAMLCCSPGSGKSASACTCARTVRARSSVRPPRGSWHDRGTLLFFPARLGRVGPVRNVLHSLLTQRLQLRQRRAPAERDGVVPAAQRRGGGPAGQQQARPEAEAEVEGVAPVPQRPPHELDVAECTVRVACRPYLLGRRGSAGSSRIARIRPAPAPSARCSERAAAGRSR